MQEKESIIDVQCEKKDPSLRIIVEQSLMPNNDPWDGSFYLHVTPMKDSYNPAPLKLGMDWTNLQR